MGKKKILIVDDDPDVILLIESRLKLAGYDVEEAKTGRETLRKVKEEEFHLLILDRLLPDLSGEEIASQLKGDPKTSQIPIILISATKPGDAEKEVDLFLLKPCKWDELHDAIEQFTSKAS